MTLPELSSRMLRRKPISELVTWLKHNYDVVEIPLTKFSEVFLQSHRHNAAHAITNQKCHLSENEFNFIAYKLLETQKNAEYTDILTLNQGEQFVFVLFETHTGYFTTNHAKLFLEVAIEQGLDRDDYEQKNVAYLSYLQRLKSYENHEY